MSGKKARGRTDRAKRVAATAQPPPAVPSTAHALLIRAQCEVCGVRHARCRDPSPGGRHSSG